MKKIDIVNGMDNIYTKIASLYGDKTVSWDLDANKWDWIPGAGLYGIIRTYQNTKDKKYLEFLKKWFDDTISLRAFGSVNNVAPTNVPLFLLQEDCDYRYYEVVREYVDWCMNVSVRTTTNGFAHVYRNGDEDFKNQLWADTVFMSVIFLAHYGVVMKNNDAIMAALEQLEIHLDGLFDSENDLCFHAYHCITQKQFGQHWGRGNGWIVASLVEIIGDLMGKDYKTDKFVDIFKRIMEKAYSLKAENGMLHTVLDHEEAYLETTATVLFGYAAIRGYKLGILDSRFKEWAEQAAETTSKNVEPNGDIKFCSAGTGPESLETYLNTRFWQCWYGYGLTLMFFSEVLGD